ncbi:MULTISPECIES: cell division site-positioning protein MapZ family protein [Enterococcus]|uniref:cell division site-positioning protein MapZ family protein n=1 Tax=Enterococcus TaxID=1350 RepID=UPI000534256E|nr:MULTISPECIES: cell division site-positioning protein MapZ family protein [Enterococcus]MCD9223182.1 cell division site-positioning protein MapZ family protein [Enterococcus lactis]MCO5462380.1 cell division site-positioning protein MapZ family protein [Enterococcus faecium]MDQ8279900.1 cell division site-positioning protein MapZ family protein [Enterococcus faecium]MDV4518616.1 cell division site-positioning protein MapZ family protein [Enterococcus faecium]MDV4768973.1 cell division site-p
MKKCPNCGSKKMDENNICPDCGHQLTAEDQQTKETIEEINADETMQDKSTEDAVFPDTELNDPIEWSELKDLPLESVMELFEKTEPEDDVSSTHDKVANKEKMEQKKVTVHETLEKSGKNQEETLESKQKRRVAELKEIVENEEENSILSAYIKAHREDTKEEHAEELLKMISEKIAQENKVEPEHEAEKDISRVNAAGKESVKTNDLKTDVPEKTETLSEKQSEDEKSNGLPEAEKKEMLEKADKKSTESDSINNESDAESQSASEDSTVLEAKIEKEENQPELIEAETEPTTIVPNTVKTPQESNLEKKDLDKTQKKKSKKVPYLALAAVLLLGGGGWAYYDHHQKVEAEVAAEAKRQRQMEDLHGKLAAFYTDDHHQFIRADMIHQDLSKLKNDLSSLKNEKGYSELETTYQDIQSKIQDIQKVNEWFVAPVIVDDHLADDIKLKADKEIQTIETDNTDFGKLIQQAQTEAKNQYAELQTAKEKTAIVFKDGKVVGSATRDQYKTAKEAVEKVKNTDLSAQLNEQLKQVDKMLTDKEKKEEEEKKKAEEAKKAAEEQAKQAAQAAAAAQAAQQAAVAQAAQQEAASSTPSSSNSANQPIKSARASDIADASNPAWTWAPGVQSKVIATCIQRGYIVEGGYRLEKARIENGEGYYNLYATSTKSALMKGIGESALPFYIVTINCKTGWFGGNGSN